MRCPLRQSRSVLTSQIVRRDARSRPDSLAHEVTSEPLPQSPTLVDVQPPEVPDLAGR
jgi:hypothetical protein